MTNQTSHQHTVDATGSLAEDVPKGNTVVYLLDRYEILVSLSDTGKIPWDY